MSNLNVRHRVDKTNNQMPDTTKYNVQAPCLEDKEGSTTEKSLLPTDFNKNMSSFGLYVKYKHNVLYLQYCITHLLHYTHQPRANLFSANSHPPVTYHAERVKNTCFLQDTWSQPTESFLTNKLRNMLFTGEREHAIPPTWLILLSWTHGYGRRRHLILRCIKCSTKTSYRPPASTICSRHAFRHIEGK